jgi:flagellar basal-body rod protein FlgG
MSDALHIGATGMQAQQVQLDTIANNLANAATPGFKKSRVSFADLVMRGAGAGGGQAAGDGAESGATEAAPPLGSGVGLTRVTRVFDQGVLKQTGAALDVALEGDGFLEVAMPDGTRAFTRGGTLRVGADGMLLAPSGQPLKPAIQIPPNATGLVIGKDGRVSIDVPDRGTPIDAGQLELVRFVNPSALTPLGESLYLATEGAGEPLPGVAGQDGIGELSQGYLEGSNVNLVDEMVNLMVAQRAYEASVKVVQASDEMLAMVNSLRK